MLGGFDGLEDEVGKADDEADEEGMGTDEPAEPRGGISATVVLSLMTHTCVALKEGQSFAELWRAFALLELK